MAAPPSAAAVAGCSSGPARVVVAASRPRPDFAARRRRPGRERPGATRGGGARLLRMRRWGRPILLFRPPLSLPMRRRRHRRDAGPPCDGRRSRGEALDPPAAAAAATAAAMARMPATGGPAPTDTEDALTTQTRTPAALPHPRCHGPRCRRHLGRCRRPSGQAGASVSGARGAGRDAAAADAPWSGSRAGEGGGDLRVA